jgi:hypothetical protein
MPSVVSGVEQLICNMDIEGVTLKLIPVHIAGDLLCSGIGELFHRPLIPMLSGYPFRHSPSSCAPRVAWIINIPSLAPHEGREGVIKVFHPQLLYKIN